MIKMKLLFISKDLEFQIKGHTLTLKVNFKANLYIFFNLIHMNLHFIKSQSISVFN